MSRLTIDITDQQHQNLKALAALQGKSIKQYTIERLFPADPDLSELRSLLGARIAEGLAGNVSPNSIDTILNEELRQDSSN